MIFVVLLYIFCFYFTDFFFKHLKIILLTIKERSKQVIILKNALLISLEYIKVLDKIVTISFKKVNLIIYSRNTRSIPRIL